MFWGLLIMKKNRILLSAAAFILSMMFIAGCGNSAEVAAADSSVLQTDISQLSVPESVKIVGLGEASHGAKEYQQMKKDVFKSLVEHNGCRTFIIEGDFGSALKVDKYIHGGEGTAENIVSEIGFAIYHTQEMADLVEWMRSYNEQVPEGKDLHFYGMDMQRYDNNKEYLFSVLDKAAPDLSEKFKNAFSDLTDENRTSLKSDILKQAESDVQELLNQLDVREKEIVAVCGQDAFDFARECANTILECGELLESNSDYNKIRDKHMEEKIEWFLQHGDGSVIFINGHNGHVGKTSISNYKCLGALLNEKYESSYFAVGTDAEDTKFNSQDDDGNFTVKEIKNTDDFTKQFEKIDSKCYYLDFSKVSDNEQWQSILVHKQSVTSLNVGIYGWQQALKLFCTTNIIPKDTFDGVIVFRETSPTTLLN